MKKCNSFRELAAEEEFYRRMAKEAVGSDTQTIVLSGPAGIGKRTWALALAASWLCLQPTADGPCCHCSSCLYLEQETHPDLRVLAPEAKGKTIPIDEIRGQIHAEVELRPQISQTRVWIIDGDALLESAQNALLKVLEEPPSFARFIITVADKAKLLPTFMSRAVHIPVPRLTKPQLEQLEGLKKLQDPALKKFAVEFSQGLPGVALDIAENEHFGQLREDCCRWFFALPDRNEAQLLTDGYKLFDQNKGELDQVFLLLQSLFRDLVFVSRGQSDRSLMQADLTANLAKMAKAHPLGSTAAAKINILINETQHRMQANANFEMNICRMLLLIREEIENARNRRNQSK